MHNKRISLRYDMVKVICKMKSVSKHHKPAWYNEVHMNHKVTFISVSYIYSLTVNPVLDKCEQLETCKWTTHIPIFIFNVLNYLSFCFFLHTSQTSMNRLRDIARFAFHLAAPMKSAFTPFLHFFYLSLVPTTTTHQVTTIDTNWSIVTLATVSSLNPQLGISIAEIWRIFVVHKILWWWCFMIWIVWF